MKNNNRIEWTIICEENKARQITIIYESKKENETVVLIVTAGQCSSVFDLNLKTLEELENDLAELKKVLLGEA